MTNAFRTFVAESNGKYFLVTARYENSIEVELEPFPISVSADEAGALVKSGLVYPRNGIRIPYGNLKPSEILWLEQRYSSGDGWSVVGCLPSKKHLCASAGKFALIEWEARIEARSDDDRKVFQRDIELADYARISIRVGRFWMDHELLRINDPGR